MCVYIYIYQVITEKKYSDFCHYTLIWSPVKPQHFLNCVKIINCIQILFSCASYFQDGERNQKHHNKSNLYGVCQLLVLQMVQGVNILLDVVLTECVSLICEWLLLATSYDEFRKGNSQELCYELECRIIFDLRYPKRREQKTQVFYFVKSSQVIDLKWQFSNIVNSRTNIYISLYIHMHILRHFLQLEGS